MKRRIWILRAGRALLVCVAAYVMRDAFLFRNSVGLDGYSRAFPRDYFVGSKSDPVLVYVVLGDSTAQGMGAFRLQETLPYRIAVMVSRTGRRVHVINLAVSGARMNDVLDSQLSKVAIAHPDLVTLNCGGNDATHDTPLDQYRVDLDAALHELEATTSVRMIIVATPPDLAPVPALPPVVRDQMARHSALEGDILYTLAEGSPRVRIVDLFRDGKLRGREMYAADLFHPSDRGYAKLAELYRSPLLELGRYATLAKPPGE